MSSTVQSTHRGGVYAIYSTLNTQGRSLCHLQYNQHTGEESMPSIVHSTHRGGVYTIYRTLNTQARSLCHLQYTHHTGEEPMFHFTRLPFILNQPLLYLIRPEQHLIRSMFHSTKPPFILNISFTLLGLYSISSALGYFIRSRLHVIHTRLQLIHNRLNRHSQLAASHPHQATSHPH